VKDTVATHRKDVHMNRDTSVQKSHAFGEVKDFGHLLHLYRTSSDPPPLPCPWSTCDFVTQVMGMKDGKQVGAGPHIDIQLLELHVENHGVHSRSDLAYMTFTILKNMIQSLPSKPALVADNARVQDTSSPDTQDTGVLRLSPASTHTVVHNHRVGQQEGAVDKMVQMQEGLTYTTKVSLKCHQCTFQTELLKISKAKKRMASHEFSHHSGDGADNGVSEKNGDIGVEVPMENTISTKHLHPPIPQQNGLHENPIQQDMPLFQAVQDVLDPSLLLPSELDKVTTSRDEITMDASNKQEQHEVSNQQDGLSSLTVEYAPPQCSADVVSPVVMDGTLHLHCLPPLSTSTALLPGDGLLPRDAPIPGEYLSHEEPIQQVSLPPHTDPVLPEPPDKSANQENTSQSVLSEAQDKVDTISDVPTRAAMYEYPQLGFSEVPTKVDSISNDTSRVAMYECSSQPWTRPETSLHLHIQPGETANALSASIQTVGQEARGRLKCVPDASHESPHQPTAPCGCPTRSPAPDPPNMPPCVTYSDIPITEAVTTTSDVSTQTLPTFLDTNLPLSQPRIVFLKIIKEDAIAISCECIGTSLFPRHSYQQEESSATANITMSPGGGNTQGNEKYNHKLYTVTRPEREETVAMVRSGNKVGNLKSGQIVASLRSGNKPGSLKLGDKQNKSSDLAPSQFVPRPNSGQTTPRISPPMPR
jgi:hypothetical protein